MLTRHTPAKRSRSGRGNTAGPLTLVTRRNGSAAAPAGRGISAGVRERISSWLDRYTPRERLMLALLLYERMSPREVANALGLSAAEVTRTYRVLLVELERALRAPARRSLNGIRSRDLERRPRAA